MKKGDMSLAALGGTFVHDGSGHDGSCLASYLGCEEAREDDLRVAQVGQYKLPERWFSPANEIKSDFVRGRKLRKRAECHVLAGEWLEFDNFSADAYRDLMDDIHRPNAKVHVPEKKLRELLLELLTLKPNYFLAVFDKAKREKRFNVLNALPDAVWYLSGKAKEVVAAQINGLKDNEDRSVKRLRAAVA
ncbi:MAG TPA: hypothetical protein VD862_02655 [Candidatus Paceibacterota bacterium]|nr:hypothetical protein [Candidatus Paceibacterota bacterium]